MQNKVCSKCCKEKSVKMFFKDSSRKDGIRGYCIQCASAQYKAWSERNKEKKKEYMKSWRKANATHCKLYDLKYSRENKKKKKEYMESPALFATYAQYISVVERVRNKNGVLEATCTYCGKWFIPTVRQIKGRKDALNSVTSGRERRLYCSNGCKKECSIYYQKKYPKGFKKDSSREVQPELRQMIFKRDDYECQICGSTESIHCHHITGVEQNPIESADLDNCITLCKKCHKWIHSQEGCTTYDLRCQKYGEAL